ncbi:efflux RND transporter periplasmic adaptor subunit [uncultured Ferrimonas sp.]|uniref:efflux RND transporter periplasmic adaptor subunit n=1 Tax=uncultured Ferrimonas sp. TaxID=432640 RepID=UPI00260C7E05|nr:efflux RND transporter periplasmic adaptor subunit [uncultured Ferrimonas sp.]
MKLTLTPIAITLVCGASIFAAVAYNGSQMQQQAQRSAPKQAPSYPTVAVQPVEAAFYQPQVQGYGEAMPHYQLALTAQSSGQVLQLTDAFASGNLVSQGQLLAKLEDSQYRQAVSDANKAVADAQLALLEEQRQGQQALLEWQRSGLTGQPDSSLVLRQPQLTVAKAALAQAQQQLASAQVDLANTEIRAPFNGLVVSRDIQLGSYLQQGGSVATLYSTDQSEIKVPLSQQQWQALGGVALGTDAIVPLISSDGSKQWQGYAARIEQHLSQTDRQRSLVVVVDKPLEQPQPLFAGEFVRATIRGHNDQALWRLPATAVSQANQLWLLQANNTIAPVAAQQAFSDQHYVYLHPSAASGSAEVVLRPLNSYLSGMLVNPVQEQ